MSTEHRSAALGFRHAPHNFEFTTQTERLAATVTSDNMRQTALVLADSSTWRVVDAGAGALCWEPFTAIPAAHGHAIAEVTGLQAVLAAKLTGSLDTDPALTANSDGAVASQRAVKAYVDGKVAGLLAMKGGLDCSASPNYPAAALGDAYIVSAAGKVGGASGAVVDVGDMVLCVLATVAGNQADVGARWQILEHNLIASPANALTDKDVAGVKAGPISITSTGNTVGSVLTVTTTPGVNTANGRLQRNGLYIEAKGVLSHTLTAADVDAVITFTIPGFPYVGVYSAMAPAPTIALDFRSGVPALATFTRSSSKTDLLFSDAPGRAYNTYAANTPVVDPARGILNEGPCTNLIKAPTAPANQETLACVAGQDYVFWINGAVGAFGALSNGSGTFLFYGSNSVATHGNPVFARCITSGTCYLSFNGTVNAAQLELGTTPSSFAPIARAADNLQPAGAAIAAMTPTAGNSGTVIVGVAMGDNTTAAYSTFLKQGGISIGRSGGGDGQVISSDTIGSNPITAVCGTGTTRSARVALAWGPAERRLCANGGAVKAGTKLYNGAPGAMAFGGNNDSYPNGWITSVELYDHALNSAALQWLTRQFDVGVTMWGDSLTARNDGFAPRLYAGNDSVATTLSGLLNQSVLNCGVDGETYAAINTRFQATPALWQMPAILWGGRNGVNATGLAAMVASLGSQRKLVLSVINMTTAVEASGQSAYTSLIALNTTLASTYGNEYLDVRAALVAATTTADPADSKLKSQDQIGLMYHLEMTEVANTTILDASMTTMTTNAPLQPDTIVKIENEYIYIQTVSGNNVTSMIRGWAGTAAAHGIRSSVRVWDNTHLNQAGRVVVANAILAKMRANGWVIAG